MCFSSGIQIFKQLFPYIPPLSIPKLKHPWQALEGCGGVENEPANVCMLANKTVCRSIKHSGRRLENGVCDLHATLKCYRLLPPMAWSKILEPRENGQEVERDANISLESSHVLSVSGPLQDRTDKFIGPIQISKTLNWPLTWNGMLWNASIKKYVFAYQLLITWMVFQKVNMLFEPFSALVFPKPQLFSIYCSPNISCRRRQIVYSFIVLMGERAVQNTHMWCVWTCQCQGHCFFSYVLQSSALWLCFNSMHQSPNMHSELSSSPPKDGKGNLKDVCLPSKTSPSSLISPAFNGSCRALQPHRTMQRTIRTGGKRHLWTAWVTTAKMKGWTGLLVERLLFASLIRSIKGAGHYVHVSSGQQCVTVIVPGVSWS